MACPRARHVWVVPCSSAFLPWSCRVLLSSCLAKPLLRVPTHPSYMPPHFVVVVPRCTYTQHLLACCPDEAACCLNHAGKVAAPRLRSCSSRCRRCSHRPCSLRLGAALARKCRIVVPHCAHNSPIIGFRLECRPAHSTCRDTAVPDKVPVGSDAARARASDLSRTSHCRAYAISLESACSLASGLGLGRPFSAPSACHGKRV